MKRHSTSSALVCAAALALVPAAVAQNAINPALLGNFLPSPVPCALTTVALGDFSGWGLSTPGFLGEDLVIRDQGTWLQFWAQHSSNVSLPPELPYIDFTTHVVLACIQGPQTSGGMPGIVISNVYRWPNPSPQNTGGAVTVTVVDDERPGPLDVITNPYHIVMLPRACLPPNLSLTFRHVAPAPGTGVVRGRVFVAANSQDWLPLPGAFVRLLAGSATGPTARSGLDGSYFFLNAVPGTYVLSVQAGPYAGQTATVQVTADARTEQDFYLTP